MEKELIDILGLRTWFDARKITNYPLYTGKEELYGQPLQYLEIDPNDEWYRGKINVISAPLGMGKTTIFNKLQKGSVLYVSPRRDLIKQFISNNEHLDLLHYEKSEAKPHMTRELLEADSLGLCNLSLNRLGSAQELKGYGHVIFDEWELDMTTSVSNKAKNMQGDEDIRRTLIEESKTVWILGWTFRDYTFEYLKDFNKDINFEKFHKDIATDIEVNIYANQGNLINSIKENLSQAKRVMFFTEKKEGLKDFMQKEVSPNIDSDWSYFDKKKRPTDDECKRFNDKDKQSKEELIGWTPIASHGYNLRNEGEHSALLFNNGKRSLGGSDIVQFAFRNRDMKTIDAFITQNDEKKISQLKQLRISPPQPTTEQTRLYGKWNRLTKRYELEMDNVITERWIEQRKYTLVEKALRQSVALLELGWLGVKKINHVDPIEDLRLERVRSNPEKIIAEGRILNKLEYSEGTYEEQAYTEIANDLGVEELTLKHIKFHDKGKWKENELRRLQMWDNHIVKTAQAKASGYLQDKTKWNGYQYMATKFLDTNLQIITQAEFKTSDFWIAMKNNEKSVNYVMKNNGTPNLCITADDKAKPLNWLKKYLTAHNYDCEIYKPSKERKQELRIKAEKSMKKEYAEWKKGQKELPIEKRFRELTNQRITHYLEFLIANKRHKELTEEMKELRLVNDEWNMSIKDYSI